MKRFTNWFLFLSLATFIYACGANAETHQAKVPVQVASSPDTTPPDPVMPVDTPDTPSVQMIPSEVLLGQISPRGREEFSVIESRYTTKQGIYMHTEAYEAFIAMYNQAFSEGVELKIVSALRNFNSQKGIWERKWTGATRVGGKNLAQSVADPAERALAILTYSSMPGTSRHHWGTDIDLNNLNNEWFETGKGKRVYEWLVKNAPNYGFCQPYSPKGEERPHGYNEEKWHWSYMPIASEYLRQYRLQVSYDKIKGFKGSEVAEDIQVIDRYVAGIAPKCLSWAE